MVGDAEHLHRLVELAAAVLAEAVRRGRRRGASRSGTSTSPISPAVQVTSVTPRALGDVARHRGAVVDRTRRRGGRARAAAGGRVMVAQPRLGALDRLRAPSAGRSGGRRAGPVRRPPPSPSSSQPSCGVDEHLEHEGRGVADDRPRVVLVVVLARPAARARPAPRTRRRAAAATTACASSSSKKIALTGAILAPRRTAGARTRPSGRSPRPRPGHARTSVRG